MSLPTSDDSSSSNTAIDRALFPDIHRDDVIIGEHLGVGTFGAVFSGTWILPDGQHRSIALKKVFVLEKEAEILSKVRHRNIIQFYGICKSDGSDFFIVTECAQNGSLYDYIHSGNTTPYSFDNVIEWSRQIANGIHYLHYDAIDTIIHRDLKSKNVVLDNNLVCKICDFGTSKNLTHSCTAPSWGGTAAWMSPEMILQTEGLTTATDVWSYGVVLWEMLSRELPYKDYTEFRIFSLVTQNGISLVIPDTCPQQLKQLMNNCWKMMPKERINMKQVLNELLKLERNKKAMDECEKFMGLEDWKSEIENQSKQIEKMRKDLEKRQEKLRIQEKALKQRLRNEQIVAASTEHPPEDVNQWNEHHTTYWIRKLLQRISTDPKFLNKVSASFFRHRITGLRLIAMSENDLKHIGIHKGSSLLIEEIRKLRVSQETFKNFPTLEQARRIEMEIKSERETAAVLLPNDLSLVIIVGIYVRKINPLCRKFKFYADSDWLDSDLIPAKSPSRHASSFIKTVCFSVLDEVTKTPINEPTCSISNGMTSNPEWLTVEIDDNMKIRCIVSVYYADNVTQPRNTEIIEVLTSLEESKILSETEVRLKFRRSSSSILNTPSPTLTHTHHPLASFHHTVSSPQLRGFWQRKITHNKHGLTETELSSLQEKILTPLSSTSELEDEKKIGRRRRTTTTASEESEGKPKSSSKSNKKTVHGGKDKWNWKGSKSRPKFS